MSASRSLVDLANILQESPPARVAWTDVFGNDRPVELEVGTGKGLFLSNAAAATPAHNFVGIEVSSKYARRTADRARKRGLTNLRVFRGDALRFVRDVVPADSLHAVHVYFPDPWWKKRHRKRRVFTWDFVACLERTLSGGGTLRYATDVEEYFDAMRRILSCFVAFSIAQNGADADAECTTSFDRKYQLEGRPIYRSKYWLKR